jgi:phage anti-repressor protein
MNELIKIGKSPKTGNPIVNARDLHAVLEVGEDFSNWLKRRLKSYKFVENVDYARIFFDYNGKRIRFAKNSESDSQILARIYRIEYALTLDCAKAIALVQNNEMGSRVRQYFIEKEKEFWILKDKLETRSELNYGMSEVAKLLNLSDYYGKIGRNALYNILYHQKIVDEKNRPVKKYVKKGYFLDEYPTRVTEDGLKWLNQRFVVEKSSESGEVKGLKKLVEEMRKKQELQEQNQELIISGVATVVETLFFNKGGKKTEEQNRLAMGHLQNFLERVGKLPKGLNE